MNLAYEPVNRIKIGLIIGLTVALTGCGGYVAGGYSDGYESGVVVQDPDVFLFGGGYYEGRGNVHAYSHRGFQSRGGAHGGGHGHRR